MIDQSNADISGSRNFQHDWNGDNTLTETILNAVATMEGNSPTELEPLTDRVDPDALNELFSTRFGGGQRLQGNVRFPFHGYAVTIYADGEIIVQSPSHPSKHSVETVD